MAYAAGLLDGDGNIGFYRNRDRQGHPGFFLSIGVANNDQRVTDWLHDRFGGTVYINPKPGYEKPLRYWNLRGEDAREFLSTAVHHLVIKSEQARVALTLPAKYQKAPEERQRIWETIRSLNARGRGMQNRKVE